MFFRHSRASLIPSCGLLSLPWTMAFTSLDWTTQAHSAFSRSKVSLMFWSLMPRLQLSIRMVLKPSSLAWCAVEAEKEEYQVSTIQPSLHQLTHTDIRSDATHEYVAAILLSDHLLQGSLTELGVVWMIQCHADQTLVSRPYQRMRSMSPPQG